MLLNFNSHPRVYRLLFVFHKRTKVNSFHRLESCKLKKKPSYLCLRKRINGKTYLSQHFSLSSSRGILWNELMKLNDTIIQPLLLYYLNLGYNILSLKCLSFIKIKKISLEFTKVIKKKNILMRGRWYHCAQVILISCKSFII